MAEGKKRLYHRATANAALYNSLVQALSVNYGTTARPYPFYVADFGVFGSLVTTLGKVHDVDIFIGLADTPEYAAKRKDDTFIQSLIDWSFKYIPDRACRSAYPFTLPEDDLRRTVKSGRGIISLHSYRELELLQCPYVPLISGGKLTTAGEIVQSWLSIEAPLGGALCGIYPLGATVDMDGVFCMVFLEMYPYVKDGGIWLDAQTHAYDAWGDIMDALQYDFCAHSSDGKLFGMQGVWTDGNDLEENLAGTASDLLPSVDRAALQQLGISNDHPYALTDVYALMDQMKKAGLQRIHRAGDAKYAGVLSGTINDPVMTDLIDLYRSLTKDE